MHSLLENSAFIGCAGWNIPARYGECFSSQGSHLERYATRFKAVEINSSFYRSHRPQTYAKWASLVPESFRFAVKIPKVITHQQRLKEANSPLQHFLEEVAQLGSKLGPLLLQLPPSLIYEEQVAHNFFSELRERFQGHVVCEPRHPTWFTPEPNELLTTFEVARAATDPAITPLAALPGGWKNLIYYRLHGSPTIYRSSYSKEFIDVLSTSLQTPLNSSIPTWCIFDNTAEGEATRNALELKEKIVATR